MIMQGDIHIPVLLGEVLEGLSLTPGQRVLDCTVGLGGHAKAMLERITPGGVLIGIDYDAKALEFADTLLRGVRGARYHLFQGPYSQLKTFLSNLKIEKVDAVLFDLGVSSLQLDSPERGFSFRYDSFLDMRMDQRGSFTAADLINSLSEQELATIFRTYGEERFAHRIAKAIVEKRFFTPIETTKQLADIVLQVIPNKRMGKIHPATRVFQALRIAVNRELRELEQALNLIPEILSSKGRIAIISFHSLEDRIVKHTFRRWQKQGLFTVLTKKPIRPSQQELKYNRRAKSAKLRIAEKIK